MPSWVTENRDPTLATKRRIMTTCSNHEVRDDLQLIFYARVVQMHVLAVSFVFVTQILQFQPSWFDMRQDFTIPFFLILNGKKEGQICSCFCAVSWFQWWSLCLCSNGEFVSLFQWWIFLVALPALFSALQDNRNIHLPLISIFTCFIPVRHFLVDHG